MKTLKLLFSVALLAVTSALLAQGNCTEDDLLYIGDNLEFVQGVAAQCGQDCLFAADPEACFAECMSAQVELTEPCVACFSEQTNCAVDNCFFPCVFGTEAECAACIEASCLADFQVCAGIEDADNDGFTNLSDCDDTNPNVYPEAPGTNEGIDNNCDGIIDATECLLLTWYADTDNDGFGDPMSSIDACEAPAGYVSDNTDCDDNNDTIYPGAPGMGLGFDNNCNGNIDPDEENNSTCTGDINNDQAVNAEDLLLILSAYGCSFNCGAADLDGCGIVGISDLLVLLSGFGNLCN